MNLNRAIRNRENKVFRANNAKNDLLKRIDYVNEEIIRELCFDGEDDD